MCLQHRRSLAISRRIMLEFWNFLTFSKIMLGQGWKSHFEHILIDCPENGPSLTKTYKFFDTKIINFDFFFKILINKTFNFRSNLNYWCSEDFFEVLHASLAQKLTNLDDYDFLWRCHWSVWWPTEARLMASATWSGSQLLDSIFALGSLFFIKSIY